MTLFLCNLRELRLRIRYSFSSVSKPVGSLMMSGTSSASAVGESSELQCHHRQITTQLTREARTTVHILHTASSTANTCTQSCKKMQHDQLLITLLVYTLCWPTFNNLCQWYQCTKAMAYIYNHLSRSPEIW